MGEVALVVFGESHGQDKAFLGKFVGFVEFLGPMFVIHGKLAQGIQEIPGCVFGVRHLRPEGHGLVPLFAALILGGQAAAGGKAYLM